MQGDGIRIVRSDGEELWVTAGPEDGWHIEAEGLSEFIDLPIELSTSANVLSDGSTLVSKRVGEVERQASFVWSGPGNARSIRDTALSFFNPKHSYECHVTHIGVTRWCEGELAARQCVIQPSRFPCRVTFTLLCLDPYMRGEDVHDDTMRDAAPFFTFPFRCFLPGPGVSAGCVPSLRVYDGLNTIKNEGAVPSPFRITAEFGAEVKNPTFRVNDRHVTMLCTFKSGDTLVIDFMVTPPTVTVNGSNAIQRCSRDSTFVGMVLDVGENTFTYEVESGDVNTMTVSIVRYDRYLGV